MALHGSVCEVVPASAEELFAVVTDVERLPEWNEIIQRVVEAPGKLTNGAEWVVEIKAFGQRWRSRSQVIECDAHARRFVYRTQTDDGNPSFAIWTWQIEADPAGSRVTVRWELRPKTFWRRVLLGRIRNHQLRKEVRASIPASAGVVRLTS